MVTLDLILASWTLQS